MPNPYSVATIRQRPIVRNLLWLSILSLVRPRIPISLLFLVMMAGMDLVCQQAIAQNGNQQIDKERLLAAGLDVTVSPHLTLITDVKNRPQFDDFNQVFEQAIEQWCQYFSVPIDKTKDWHITGCLISDKSRLGNFARLGLVPDDLPRFPAGYQLGFNIWFFQQEGDYYTRHLLLHEGTHAFMSYFLDGFGPPWYAEGMAEMLGIHQWKDGKLTIRHAIASKDEVPYWGRVKLIRQDRDNGNTMSMDQVMEMPPESFRNVNSYGWAWAACEFLDSHPVFQDTFRKLPAIANKHPREFNRILREQLDDKRALASAEFQQMIDEIEYGYDAAAAATIPVAESKKVGDGAETRLKLATNRAWQSTGVQIETGQTWNINSQGKFQVKKKDGRAWPCTANGVSIEYYQGRPLGRLLGAIRSEKTLELTVFDIGPEFKLVADVPGTLLLRINESPANWKDNQGHLDIVIKKQSD